MTIDINQLQLQINFLNIHKNTYRELVYLMERDCKGYRLHQYSQFNTLYLYSEVNELGIRFNLPLKHLVITHVKLHHQRQGIFTNIIHFLEQYGLKYGFTSIVIENATSLKILSYIHRSDFKRCSVPTNYIKYIN